MRTQVIDCGNAVALARDRLPSAHPAITRIQFLYGDFRPILGKLSWDGVRAFVVVTFADASRLAIPLTLYEGRLTAEVAETY